MDKNNMAKKFQETPVNILADIGTLAKKTSNILDLSIGDPDLITDEASLMQLLRTFHAARQSIQSPAVTSN